MMSFEVHTIQEPLWIKSLIEDVIIDSITPYEFIGPLGYRWLELDNPTNIFNGWQIIVFPTPNEIRGPVAYDGYKQVSGFSLNITHIISVMTNVESIIWNAPASYNGDLTGPEISLQGSFAGRHIWLRFFALPPSDEPCSHYIDPSTGKVVKIQE